MTNKGNDFESRARSLCLKIFECMVETETYEQLEKQLLPRLTTALRESSGTNVRAEPDYLTELVKRLKKYPDSKTVVFPWFDPVMSLPLRRQKIIRIEVNNPFFDDYSEPSKSESGEK